MKLSLHTLLHVISDMPHAVAIYDSEDLNIALTNEKMLNIWSRTDNLVGRKLGDVFPEYIQQGFEGLLRNVWITGETYTGYDIPADITVAGIPTCRYFDFEYKPLIDSNGHTYALLHTATDVTDRKLAWLEVARREASEAAINEELNASNEELQAMNEELTALNEEYISTNEQLEEYNVEVQSVNEKLHHNKAQLANALQAANLGTYDLDLTSGLMSCSEQCKANFGQPVDIDFSYSDLLKCILPDYHKAFLDTISSAINNKESFNVEYQIKRADDSIHWIQSNGTPQYNKGGSATRIIGVTQLITEKRNYQAKKDEFLSVASHELKTPLTVLKASVQMLQKMKPKINNETVIKLIDTCHGGVERVDSMLAEYLDAGRYADGRIVLNTSYFWTNDLLKESIQHLSEIDKHKLKIVGVDIQVNADKNRLEQVIVNFINNAYKYAADSKEIILSAAAEEDYITISVHDFGPGIAKEDLPHVFDRYWQKNNYQESVKGVGLGLYISSEIIHKHGGKIGVNSTSTGGTSFWFQIPIGL